MTELRNSVTKQKRSHISYASPIPITQGGLGIYQEIYVPVDFAVLGFIMDLGSAVIKSTSPDIQGIPVTLDGFFNGLGDACWLVSIVLVQPKHALSRITVL